MKLPSHAAVEYAKSRMHATNLATAPNITLLDAAHNFFSTKRPNRRSMGTYTVNLGALHARHTTGSSISYIVLSSGKIIAIMFDTSNLSTLKNHL